MKVISPGGIPTTEDEVVATLRRHAADYRNKKRFVTSAMIVVGVGLFAAFVFNWLGLTPPGWSNVIEFMPWFLVFVGGGAMMARQQLQDSAKRAGSFSDKRLLAPILELLDSEHESERMLACEAVKRILPLFTEEDFSELSQDCRLKLLKSIRYSWDPNYVTAVIAAAKNYGGNDCIAPLDEFIKSKISMRKKDKAWSGSLAHMALADIRMRVARSRIEMATNPENDKNSNGTRLTNC